MTPSEAFGRLVDGDVELVPLDQLDGRISAVMCVLYPPGIPVIVPGERFEQDVRPIARYAWADAFPGFENEMQGVTRVATADGRAYDAVQCVAQVRS